PCRFHAAPTHTIDVLEDRAAAHGLLRHDLVLAARLKQRQVQRMPLALDARADLALHAGRRFQVEVGAGAAGAIGGLGQRRRLEALADVGIQVHALAHAPQQAGDRAGGAVFDATAVVGIAGRDEVVIDFQPHLAAAHAADQTPLRREGPVNLRIEVAVARSAALVAAQRGRRAEGVVETLAPLALGIEVGAQRPLQRQAVDRLPVRPARAGTAVAAVEIDHAAGRGRPAGEAQRLEYLPLAAIDARVQRVLRAELVLDHHAELRLADGLARIEGQRIRRHAARIV